MFRGSLQRSAKELLNAAMLFGIAAILFGISTQAQAQSDVRVKVDEASVVPLVKNPSTVIVGNPSIADVSVQNGNLLVVMGKTYGSTNIIALDSTGEEIAHMEVSVTSGGRYEVSYHRGSSRITYNCAPRCEREVNVGDGIAEFDTIVKQVGGKVGLVNPESQESSESE